MNIIVLPASGQNFVCQLAILQHLCEIKYEPSLMLGSSGGNLAAYLVCAADWNSHHIERLAKELKSHYFAQPWNGIKLLSGAIGFFNGNAFQAGYGLHEFMKTYFTPQSITKYEIWTGTYNQDLQKFRLFCNCKKSSSIIQCDDIDYNLTQSLKPHFCDGDIDQITNAGLASAAVPGVIAPVLIDGYHYTDGAVCGASPLSVCQNTILKYIKTTKQPIHITYINSKDLSQANIKPNYNLFDTWIAAVNNLIKSQTLLDRLTAHELLFNSKDVNYTFFECNYENLIKNKLKREKTTFSLLEIYPTLESDINITEFTGEDVVRNLKIMYKSCQCHFWWVD
jgi:hypothetical protein